MKLNKCCSINGAIVTIGNAVKFRKQTFWKPQIEAPTSDKEQCLHEQRLVDGRLRPE